MTSVRVVNVTKDYALGRTGVRALVARPPLLLVRIMARAPRVLRLADGRIQS
jgi:hypothetical protein